MLGFDAQVIDGNGDVGAALDAALASRQPVVVDIHADPSIPPLPPNVTAQQARDYLMALAKRDPDALKVIKASVKQMFA